VHARLGSGVTHEVFILSKEVAYRKNFSNTKILSLEKKRRGFEDDEDDEEGETDQIHDVISKRLKREELEESGKFKHSIAESYSKEKVSSLVHEDGFKVYRDHKCHKQSVTSITIR
jgi:hypothetical protein